MEIIQVSIPSSVCGLGTNPKQSERQTLRVSNNIARLSDLLDMSIEQYAPGEVAAIVPLGLKKALREHWRRQGRKRVVRLAHFNAIRGQDAFRDVRLPRRVVAPLPPPDEIERMAATIFVAVSKVQKENRTREEKAITGCVMAADRKPRRNKTQIPWSNECGGNSSRRNSIRQLAEREPSGAPLKPH